MENVIKQFGFGKCVVDTGTYDGLPAVFIAPSSNPGIPGTSAKREMQPTDKLMDGEIVLTFLTDEHASLVADALVGGE